MAILFLPLSLSPLFASRSSFKPLKTNKPLRSPTQRPSSFPYLASSAHGESSASPNAFLESDPRSLSQPQSDPPGFRYKAPVQPEPSTESKIERVIFDFRFLALLAVGGSLAGSLLCFLNGCIYIFEAYRVYWTCCVKGHHSGQMVLRLVEAIDVYLAGTVMLIFGMGLYGLFISNVPPGVPPVLDRALKGSSLFGMFSLKITDQERHW